MSYIKTLIIAAKHGMFDPIANYDGIDCSKVSDCSLCPFSFEGANCSIAMNAVGHEHLSTLPPDLIALLLSNPDQVEESFPELFI